MAERRLLKHGLGEAAIDRIAKALRRVLPGFKQKAFREQALAGIDADSAANPAERDCAEIRFGEGCFNVGFHAG